MNNKSWSTIRTLTPLCSAISRITLLNASLCSMSRYALGSSSRYKSAGCARQCAIATLCSSPPDRVFNGLSSKVSISKGLISWFWYFAAASFSKVSTNSSLLPSKYCGLYATFILVSTSPESAFITPAKIFTKVVLPIPFSPRMPIIWFLPIVPSCACRWKLPSFLSIAPQVVIVTLLIAFGGGRERNFISWSLNLIFSSRMNPSR